MTEDELNTYSVTVYWETSTTSDVRAKSGQEAANIAKRTFSPEINDSILYGLKITDIKCVLLAELKENT